MGLVIQVSHLCAWRSGCLVMVMLKERGAARRNGKAFAPMLSLNFEHLSTVVNGTDGNALESRPVDNCFTILKISQLREKIGFVRFS